MGDGASERASGSEGLTLEWESRKFTFAAKSFT